MGFPQAAPTRFPQGVNTCPALMDTLAEFGTPDPTRYHVFWEDFDDYAAADWVRTAVGTGTSAVQQEDNGVLLTTNSAADDDAIFYQWSGRDLATVAETFKFIAGKKLWFKARLKISDITQSDFIMGLQITDTTPLAVTDGVYWRKDDGDSDLDFVVIKDSSATTATLSGLIANNTYFTIGFYYDGGTIGASGVGKVHYFFNDLYKGYSVVTNLVDDEELAISFGIQNGEAVAKTMSNDYIFCAKER